MNRHGILKVVNIPIFTKDAASLLAKDRIAQSAWTLDDDMRYWWVNQNQTYRHEVKAVSVVAETKRQRSTESIL